MMNLSKIRIFYNPGCSTCRNVLGLIQNAGITPEIIDYMKKPPSKEQLREMISKMNLSAKSILRTKDPLYQELQLNDSDNDILDAIVKYPKLLERPIVESENKIKLCRPPATVLELLPPQQRHYVFENGDIVKSDGKFCPKQSIGEYKNILVEQLDTIRVVSINRPDRRNAVDESTALELLDAFENINQDMSITAAVLTGKSGTFCAGYDLKSLSENPLVHDPTKVTRTNSFSNPSDFNRSGHMGPSRLPMRVPVIAAVEGYAVAGGLELSLWCDIRVSSSSAIFGVHCRRWGVPLIDGGTIRLPRLIGQSRAMDMILTGRDVRGEEAHSIGLVNRLVEDGRALQAGIDYALEISRFPAMCMNKDRNMVNKQWNMSMTEALLEEGKGGKEMDQIMKLAAEGATRFAKGKGRGGDKNNI